MLTLYAHPLSSFCWKALIALYENQTPFALSMLDESTWADYAKRWPIARMPALHDSERDQFIPEATIVIEYLDQHYRGGVRFIPDDAECAREVRLWDRFFDLYLQVPMQKLVSDRLRGDAAKDPHGVDEAKRLIATGYDVLEAYLGERAFAVGDTFTMADCAAAPALFYAEKNLPLARHPRIDAYLERLTARASFSRVLSEAGPYFHLVPSA